MTWDDEKAAIREQADTLPETFSLRAFPDYTFMVNRHASYSQRFTNGREVIQLVIDRWDQESERWLSFSKGQLNELKAEIIPEIG